jgi:hypothetical protein
MAYNVGRLKKLIENLPDDMPLVTSSFDHQYRSVTAGVGEAENLCGNYFNEYHGPEFVSDSRNEIIDVLIFD